MSAAHDERPGPQDGGLLLAEETLLLAYDGKTGKDRTDAGADAALAGALLLDLAAAGCVRAEGRHLVVTGQPAPSHPLLAVTLDQLAGATRQRSADGWLRRLSNDLSPLKSQVAQGLVERGILTEQEHRTLGIFRTTRYPQTDPEPERLLRERVGAVVLDQRPATPHDTLLLAILVPYDLVGGLVTKDDRRAANRHAREIAEHGAAEAAVQETRGVVMAAVKAAVVDATMTTSGT